VKLAASVLLLVVTGSSEGKLPETPDVTAIVQGSVQNTKADWEAAPEYSFTEHDLITNHGKRTDKSYEVVMIDGSPYHKLLAINGRQLTPAQTAAENTKLQREEARRQKETPGQRQRRIAQYRKQRHQDQMLMLEMVKAFDFKMVGEDTIDGRRCFELAATPRPDYRPPTRDTKVLKGMRGTMWIDEEQTQWVRVQAEVFRPVAFGLFFVHVRPGTQFLLEQRPVQGNIWLPSHFYTKVNANVLFFSRQSTDDEAYSQYRKTPQQTAAF